MKRLFWLVVLLSLTACASPEFPQTIKIIDGENIILQSSDSRVPVEILHESGISLNPADRVLLNGQFTDPNTPLDCESCILQVRRAVKITLITDGSLYYSTHRRKPASRFRYLFQSLPRASHRDSGSFFRYL